MPPQRSGWIEASQSELPLEKTKQFPGGNIHADPGIQVRARMDDEAVEDYADRMKAGDNLSRRGRLP